MSHGTALPIQSFEHSRQIRAGLAGRLIAEILTPFGPVSELRLRYVGPRPRAFEACSCARSWHKWAVTPGAAKRQMPFRATSPSSATGPFSFCEVAVSNRAGAGLPRLKADVPQPHAVVPAAGGQRLAVRAEGHAPHPVGVALEGRAERLTGRDVPQD